MAGYAEIAEHFRRQIESGELRPGDRLPTLREVMQEFEVAQQTASRAYKVLRTKGLTVATTGGGTVVAPLSSNDVPARIRSWATTGRALPASETSRILAVGMVGVDEVVASRLGVEPGTPVAFRQRVVERNGAPVHTSTSYYPPYVMEVTPELGEPVSTGASRELAAERLNSPQADLITETNARLATEAEKEIFGLTGIVPVQQEIRTVFLADGRIVEVAVKVISGAIFTRSHVRL